MLRLSPRLQLAADQVPANCRFADVGTDHAFLPVWLVDSGRISRAIASDLRRGPLERAAATVEEHALTGAVELRLCDGLSGLAPHEADCIAITGMGGEAIRAILSAAEWTKRDTLLLLQPQSNQPELRLWLAGAGYRIQREHCLREEGRWYTLLEVRGGEEELPNPAQALIGFPDRWAAGEPWGAYLRHQLTRLERQWTGLMEAREPEKERLAELAQLMETLDSWLEEYPQEDEA